jgi:hypothetical protein
MIFREKQVIQDVVVNPQGAYEQHYEGSQCDAFLVA